MTEETLTQETPHPEPASKTERRGVGQPLVTRLARSWVGLRSKAPYTLEDMAADGAAVLDHLGISQAHIVGASMGGMIAQVFAGQFAQRTRTLGVIFSSNNSAFLPPPAPSALLALLKGPRPDSPREVILDNAVMSAPVIQSKISDRGQITMGSLQDYQGLMAEATDLGR